MRPYGRKPASKICECIQCGKQKKGAFPKRERRKAKEEIENETLRIQKDEKASR